MGILNKINSLKLKTIQDMSLVRLGINGFGRIGRLTTRSALAQPDRARVMAINDPFMDKDYLIYLLKYDSSHGTLKAEIEKTEGGIKADGHHINVYHEKTPADIKWGASGADYICESTGVFTKKDTAGQHVKGGAKKAIISAPPKDDAPIFVVGVNHHEYKSDMTVVSNASCTTNCLAPVAKVLHDNWRIEEGLMTTIHALPSTNLPSMDHPREERTGELEEQLDLILFHPLLVLPRP